LKEIGESRGHPGEKARAQRVIAIKEQDVISKAVEEVYWG